MTAGDVPTTGTATPATRLSARRRELLARMQAGPVGDQRPAPPPETGPLVTIKRAGHRPPLFLAPAVSGSAYAYLGLGRLLHPDQPADSFEAPGLTDHRPPLTGIGEIAAQFVTAIRRRTPAGPYLLAGWSFGGTVAFEIARQLTGAGARVALLALIDGAVPGPFPAPSEREVLHAFVADLAGLRGDLAGLPTAPAGATAESRHRWLVETLRRHELVPDSVDDSFIRTRFAVFRANMRAHRAYRPHAWTGPAVIVRGASSGEPWTGWRSWLPDQTPVQVVPGDHYTMWSAANLPSLAGALDTAIIAAIRARPAS